MHPRIADLQAVFAPLGLRFHFLYMVLDMYAGRCHWMTPVDILFYAAVVAPGSRVLHPVLFSQFYEFVDLRLDPATAATQFASEQARRSRSHRNGRFGIQKQRPRP